MILLPSQSVNDLRFINGDNSVLLTYGPGTLVSSLTNTPTAIVWTPPV